MNKLAPFEKGHTGYINFQPHGKKRSPKLLLASISFVVAFFLLLIVRLFQLTIVKGVYYRNLSEQNRIREIVIEAQRGKLLDRKGIALVENVAPDISSEEKRILSKRFYTQPEVFAHVIGYRQIADVQDLQNDRCINKLKLGDKVGKKGVEKLYECELRGINGKKMIEVDARGKYVRTLNILQPKNGQEIKLSIDALLQGKAYSLLEEKKGVVVGIKPKTGEVLILASTPSYNSQAFEDGESLLTNGYLKDSEKPMFNRATEGLYPPGSTFKIFLAAGALEEKSVTPKTTFEDKGFIKAGEAVFNNWYYLQYGRTDGEVDLVKAIQRSNDIYFYHLGAKMGPEKIKIWAEKFGYQRKTNIGIDEAEGTIPSPFWKEDVLHEQWYLGDTYNLSIGQGYVTVSPLQLAVATSAFANGGELCQPQLTKIQKNEKKCKKLPISQTTLDLVNEGMKRACSTGGTGYPFFDFKIKDGELVESLTPESSPSGKLQDKTKYKSIQVGCKTGTAESHAESKKTHAWFTVFAPYEDPEIVLAVLVEEGGQGSDVAAPVAKEILKTYFEREF